MGSGTPNHVNDPIVSGVWRPQDRFHYFVHDSAANITAIGQFRGTIESTRELNQLYLNGRVPATRMLTSSYHIKPATITRTGGIAAIEDSVMRPARALRDSNIAVFTNFTALSATWQTSFHSRGYVYDARSPSGIESGISLRDVSLALEQCYPNPLNPTTTLSFVIGHSSLVSLKVFDVLGREVATFVNETKEPGVYEVSFDGTNFSSGVYFYRLESAGGNGAPFIQTRKLLLLR